VNVLVSGATGYIGRRLIDALLVSGAAVTALVRRPEHGLPAGARAIMANVEDRASLEAAADGYDRVYHLAAQISFAPDAAARLTAINAGGARNVLDACQAWAAQRVVVASSACTLGLSRSAEKVLDETCVADAALQARNPYLASKLAMERVAFEAASRLHVVITNPTTVYGPGDWSLNSGSLIAQVAKARALPAPSGGSNVVDVDDVIQGLIAAGEHGRSGERYVLGGANLPFAEILDIVRAATGRRPLCIPLSAWARPLLQVAALVVGKATDSRFITPQIIGDLFAFKYYSSAKAERELGWRAQTPFAATVTRAWEFYRREGLIA